MRKKKDITHTTWEILGVNTNVNYRQKYRCPSHHPMSTCNRKASRICREVAPFTMTLKTVVQRESRRRAICGPKLET